MIGLTSVRNLVLGTILLISSVANVHAQKRQLGHEELASWNQIENVAISNDGAWVSYEIAPNEGDHMVVLYNTSSGETKTFPVSKDATFTHDNAFLVFKTTPPLDTLKALRRKKVEDDELPGDTLVIYSLANGKMDKVPDVKSWTVPSKWAGYLAYTYKPAESKPDTTEKEKEDKSKKPSAKNGFPLVVHFLENNTSDTLGFVDAYAVADEGMLVVATSTGNDSLMQDGVYVLNNPGSGWKLIKNEKGTYKQLSCDKYGGQVAFVGDTDTTKALVRDFQLYHWSSGMDSAQSFAMHDNPLLPSTWLISQHFKPVFSDDGNRIFLGLAPPPVIQDTSLLDEEIVNVEVWHYLDDRLYTQQNVLAEKERERSYLAMVDLASGKATLLANEDLPDHELDRDRKGGYVLLSDEQAYLREMSWKGYAKEDIYLRDLKSQETKPIATGIIGNAGFSPGLDHVYWYDRADSLWHIYNITTSGSASSEGIPFPQYDEENDVPNKAYGYGSAGWTTGDERFIVYDRYDLWSIDPSGDTAPERLTSGREEDVRYRYIHLDPDEQVIDPDMPLLLHMFNETTKASGYAHLDITNNSTTTLVLDTMQFTRRPVKARDSEQLVYTKESFEVFPNLQLTNDWFTTSSQISDANPQQDEYFWGSAELFHWTAYDGKELEGIIVKPENFDPSRTYPVIVNFYERSSDELYEHRTPFPHRSTINYTFYASRGYVIFNPDVVYDIGNPGGSAYNCVISGVEALIEKGYVDTARIGVQGHSWGGYQVADLITRTDIFACAESGAPLVNMINAYGGIRWETGLSRMFQYERTQSRLGATLWESPNLYFENSPLFNLDRVNTPVLIMHNDKDGHVPWHLGIEFFVAMRRLGKPAWMLNYNDEPHWPLKLQNRKDFNIRLQQFFDHYLMDAPMPKWMRDGVPAVEKGILQGYELVEDRG